jgi:thiamine kinase-like enzyme
MNEEIPKEVLQVFAAGNFAKEIPVERIGGGLINQSYKVSCHHKPDLLLQRINKTVFSNPEYLEENYSAIWLHTKLKFRGLQLPAPKSSESNTFLFLDSNNNYWRAFEFIDNANSLSVASESSQAKGTAKTFAKFTAAFADFNVKSLKTIIPDFHNLSSRYQQFEESLTTGLHERITKSLWLINELKQRERYKHFYELIIQSDDFPQRVMHHDAKIANILFDKASGNVICPVDFDTVMPGYFFSDLGDIIRSMACTHDENSIEFESISIRKDFYTAIIEGYMAVIEKQLTVSEKKYIHYAGLLMIYMQALRFLTDYLNGDIYYRIEYPEQNLNRAKNQIILLKELEEFLKTEYSFLT